jgi:phosphopantetheinyl transferase
MPRFYRANCEQITDDLLEFWLSPRERAQLDGFQSDKRRRDWLAGRLAAKALLIEYLQYQGEGDRKPAEIEVAYGPHGEPQAHVLGERLGDIALSIAHSGGRGFAGLSEVSTEGVIGVDLERLRPVRPDVIERFLSAEEREALSARFPGERASEGIILFWALKEAALKALRPVFPTLSLRQLEVHLGDRKGRTGTAQILPLRTQEIVFLSAEYRREDGFYTAWALAPPKLQRVTAMSRTGLRTIPPVLFRTVIT